MGNTKTHWVLEIIRYLRDTSGRLFSANLKELQLPLGTRIQDGSQEFATIICCICTDGIRKKNQTFFFLFLPETSRKVVESGYLRLKKINIPLFFFLIKLS